MLLFVCLLVLHYGNLAMNIKRVKYIYRTWLTFLNLTPTSSQTSVIPWLTRTPQWLNTWSIMCSKHLCADVPWGALDQSVCQTSLAKCNKGNKVTPAMLTNATAICFFLGTMAFCFVDMPTHCRIHLDEKFIYKHLLLFLLMKCHSWQWFKTSSKTKLGSSYKVKIPLMYPNSLPIIFFLWHNTFICFYLPKIQERY